MNDRVRAHLPELRRVASECGYTAYVVGGYPRDVQLGVDVTEADVVVEDGHGVDLARSFSAAVGGAPPIIFERFGTAQVRLRDGSLFEFVSARSESYRPDSRKPMVQPAGIKADIWRRDFTINTLLLDMSGQTTDPTGLALEDIRARLIRTPADPQMAFADDPLRMLRAARFMAQLGFDLEEGTAAAIGAQAHRIRPPVVSVERINMELRKLLTSEHPAQGLQAMMRHGLVAELLPELEACRGIGKGGYHDRDVWDHTVAVVAGVPADLITRMAALLHDVGKPVTLAPAGLRPMFKDHERVGAAMAEQIMRRLRFSTDETQRVSRLVALHLRPAFLEPSAGDAAVRRIIRAAGSDLGSLMDLANADVAASAYPDRDKVARLRRRMADIGVDKVTQMRSPLNGHELMALAGRGPGPWLGRAQTALLEALVDGLIDATKESAGDYLRLHPELLEGS